MLLSCNDNVYFIVNEYFLIINSAFTSITMDLFLYLMWHFITESKDSKLHACQKRQNEFIMPQNFAFFEWRQDPGLRYDWNVDFTGHLKGISSKERKLSNKYFILFREHIFSNKYTGFKRQLIFTYHPKNI